ncbi:MAG: UDP-2,3-diacylglucosamine diphosphatase [Bacteroidota bacterium]
MGKSKRREIELVVISDVHLGTYGCHAEELLKYLKSIKVKHLVLNGDIIDMWQFSKLYWPKTHTQVLKHITGMLTRNSKVTYLTGNHDENLRKFSGLRLGSFHLADKKVISLYGKKKAWIFHGDIFDVTMKHSKWLAKLGSIGYDTLILINTFINFILRLLGREKISLSKRIKDGVKRAVQFVQDFEKTAADIAISNHFDYVICGHIHQPQMRKISTAKGAVMYLNSGDWVENLTSLEYNSGQWKIYHYKDDPEAHRVKLPKRFKDNKNNEEIFNDLVNQFLSPQA